MLSPSPPPKSVTVHFNTLIMSSYFKLMLSDKILCPHFEAFPYSCNRNQLDQSHAASIYSFFLFLLQLWPEPRTASGNATRRRWDSITVKYFNKVWEKSPLVVQEYLIQLVDRQGDPDLQRTRMNWPALHTLNLNYTALGNQNIFSSQSLDSLPVSSKAASCSLGRSVLQIFCCDVHRLTIWQI